MDVQTGSDIFQNTDQDLDLKPTKDMDPQLCSWVPYSRYPNIIIIFILEAKYTDKAFTPSFKRAQNELPSYYMYPGLIGLFSAIHVTLISLLFVPKLIKYLL